MTKMAPSRLQKEIAEMAGAQRRLGLLDDEGFRKITKRDLSGETLPADQQLTGVQIRAIREDAHMSQGAFARHLRLSVGHVSKLERGEAQASGPALTLLNVIRRKGIDVLL